MIAQQPYSMAGVRSGMTARRLDWPATLARKGPEPLMARHLVWRHVPARQRHLHVLLLDVSGSMRRAGRLAWAKAWVARWMDSAVRWQCEVAILTIGGQGTQWLWRPRAARRAGIERLRLLGGGGGTPLAAGLAEVDRLLSVHRHIPVSLWLLTDGCTTQEPSPPQGLARFVLVDFDDPVRPLGNCQMWARHWKAEYLRPLLPASPIWQENR